MTIASVKQVEKRSDDMKWRRVIVTAHSTASLFPKGIVFTLTRHILYEQFLPGLSSEIDKTLTK